MTPGALSRKQAAEFVGVAPSTFDKLVKAGELPQPKRFASSKRVVWSVEKLRAALNNVPADGVAEASVNDVTNGWEGVRV